jgi:hypothetical protein
MKKYREYYTILPRPSLLQLLTLMINLAFVTFFSLLDYPAVDGGRGYVIIYPGGAIPAAVGGAGDYIK